MSSNYNIMRGYKTGELSIDSPSDLTPFLPLGNYRKIKPRYPYKWNPGDYTDQLENIQKATKIEEVRISSNLNDNLRLELLRFKTILIFYEKFIPDKYMTTKEIFLRSLEEGPAFTKWLSDQWKLSQRVTFDLNWEKLLEEEVPSLVGGVDYLFDPRCLPRWELPDPEDYKLMLEQCPKIDDDLEEVFKTKLRDILPEKLEIPERDLLDDVNFFKSTKILETEDSWKSVPNYKAHGKPTQQYTNRFRFKRTLIWKSAEEVRDALICDAPTLHTLSEVGRISGFIVKQFFPSVKVYGFDAYKSLKYLKGKYTFMMVDLKKCGLTFPRKLIIWYLEVLDDLLDSKAIRNCLEAYKSNPTLHVEGEGEFALQNGLGLGMLNEVVSIIIATIYEIAKEDDIFPTDSEGWFLGDDELIFWPEDEDRIHTFRDIIERWESYLTKFGFAVHGKKPFIAKVGQFCEQWTRTGLEMEKRTRQFSTLLNFFDATNIVEAKILFSQQYFHWWGIPAEVNDIALSLAISYWGAEWHSSEEERNLPIEMGGWVRIQDKGKSRALEYLQKDEIPMKYKRVFCHRYKTLDNFLHPIRIKKNKYLLDLLGKEDFKSIFSLNERIENLHERTEYWTQVYSKRRRFKTDYDKYYQYLLKKRKERYKAKKRINILNFVNSQEFTNVCVPDACIILKESSEMVNYSVGEITINPTDDIQRLWLNIFSDHKVRKPKKGDLTSLYQTWLTPWQVNTIKKDSILLYNFFRLLPNLLRYGTDVLGLLLDLQDRYNLDKIEILSKPISNFFINNEKVSFVIEDSIKSFPYPIDGMIVKFNPFNVPPKEPDESWGEYNRNWRISLISKLIQNKGLIDLIPDEKEELWTYISSSIISQTEENFLGPRLIPFKEISKQREIVPSGSKELEETINLDISVSDYLNWQIAGVMAHLSGQLDVEQRISSLNAAVFGLSNTEDEDNNSEYGLSMFDDDDPG